MVVAEAKLARVRWVEEEEDMVWMYISRYVCVRYGWIFSQIICTDKGFLHKSYKLLHKNDRF